MSEQHMSRQRVVPNIAKSPALAKAMKELGPMLKEARILLTQLPLREIIDPFSAETVLQRFATAEELQRIVMECTLGRIIVNTLPIRTGSHAAAIAQLAILTEDGYVVLPGRHASQQQGEGSKELGFRQLLSAETRAIRRTLRDLGLRAEYEEYDADDSRNIAAADEESKPVTHAVVSKPATKDFNEPDFSSDQDSDLPGSPEGAFALSASPANDKPVTEKTKPRTSRARADKKVAKDSAPAVSMAPESSHKRQSKPHVILSIPKESRGVVADLSHAEWPSRNNIRYQNNLLTTLNEVRTRYEWTVESMTRHVFGEDHQAFKRLASYTTKDLEALYQYFVIQKSFEQE